MMTGGGVGAGAAPKNKFAGILMAAFAAFGGILFGYDTGEHCSSNLGVAVCLGILGAGTISGVKEMHEFVAVCVTRCVVLYS